MLAEKTQTHKQMCFLLSNICIQRVHCPGNQQFFSCVIPHNMIFPEEEKKNTPKKPPPNKKPHHRKQNFQTNPPQTCNFIDYL